MAESATATPPVDQDEAPAPKAGMPMPPPLELIASIPVVLDGGQVKASWKVTGKEGDNGDFEYFAVVRVPDIDLVSAVAGQKPLAVTLKPDVNVIATQVNAIGGAPLAGVKVQLVDPETKLPAGDPVETDDQGKVVLAAPENKPHEIAIIDEDDAAPPSPEAQNDADESAVSLDAAVLTVRLSGADGSRKAGARVKIKGAGGKVNVEATADADGDVLLEGIDHGVYELEVDGKKAKAHTITLADLEHDAEPYRAIVK